MKITIQNAIEIIEQHSPRINRTEQVDLFHASGRVLAQDIVADIHQPPFDKSAMDGFACRMEDLPGELKLKGMIAAGTDANSLLNKGECIQIMTGGKVPEGADCVVMQEHSERISDEVVKLSSTSKTNICYKGEDVKPGAILLQKGTQISSAELAIIASAGITTPLCYHQPKVGIVCTGSELLDANLKPQNSKIRNTNVYQLWAQIEKNGGVPKYYGAIGDDQKELSLLCNKILDECDVLITTGGASVGAYDIIPEVFTEIGAQIHIDGVLMQPGSPVIYAQKGTKPIWGLSGNPVSSYLQFLVLAAYSLNLYSGKHTIGNVKKYRLAKGFRRKKIGRELFVPVELNSEGFIKPVPFNGSAHIAALSGIYGFAKVKAEILELKEGDFVECLTIL